MSKTEQGLLRIERGVCAMGWMVWPPVSELVSVPVEHLYSVEVWLDSIEAERRDDTLLEGFEVVQLSEEFWAHRLPVWSNEGELILLKHALHYPLLSKVWYL